MNANQINMPILSVEQVIENLSKLYVSFITKGLPIKQIPSCFLWGAPGVGKSQAVRQVADSIHDQTGKRVNVTDVRLLLFNPVDLRGIPTANEDKTLAVWLKPKIFDMDSSDDVINILLLDELSSAAQSIAAAAYQIVLDKQVGEHKLPDNCIVIACGNRVTDRSVAYKQPKALSNRLMHFEVTASFDSWKKWAVESGINPKVLGFLAFRTDLLNCFDASKDDLAFPTPRSWEMVSNIMNGVDDNPENVYSLISGCVGSGAAIEFSAWCKTHNLPDMESIFNGLCPPLPKKLDAMYALVAAMTAYAREMKDETALIENSIRYAMGMPADFSALLIRSYSAIEPGYGEKLKKMPAYRDFARTKGAALNGII